MNNPSAIFARAHEALGRDDLDGARAAADEAAAAGVDQDDPRSRHLRFMIAWLDESTGEDELEQQVAGAGDLLEAALALPDAHEAARIVIDVADALASAGEFDDAEHGLRALSEREGVSDEARSAACLIRAQILLEHHEDPEEALAILETAPALLRHDPGYLILRAATLLDLERGDEAIALLRDALAQNDEVELHYQLGLALRDAEREDEALEHLLEVRRRDIADYGVSVDEPILAEEVEDLRRRVEDVLDTLPDPVMARVASATIRVERWTSEAAVRAGADPRASLAFVGEPGDDGAEGRVEAIVVYRDALVAQIDADEEIPDVITLGLVEEFHRFFGLELIPGM
ncbi:MAG: tetratricopeptide repeat protein [Enhygromyxa sp.]